MIMIYVLGMMIYLNPIALVSVSPTEYSEYETFLAAKVYGILLKCNFLGWKSVRRTTFSRFFYGFTVLSEK